MAKHIQWGHTWVPQSGPRRRTIRASPSSAIGRRVLIESVSLMVTVSCPYCRVLLAEMRSAIMEGMHPAICDERYVATHLRARAHPGDESALVHFQGWH
jgi:hypothetical protein